LSYWRIKFNVTIQVFMKPQRENRGEDESTEGNLFGAHRAKKSSFPSLCPLLRPQRCSVFSWFFRES